MMSSNNACCFSLVLILCCLFFFFHHSSSSGVKANSPPNHNKASKSFSASKSIISKAFKVQPYNPTVHAPIKISNVSVSGISGGGFFATQVHVAFSKSTIGAGVVAGGPYLCAQGRLDVARSTCMQGTPSVPVDMYVKETMNMVARGAIDDARIHLRNQRVYLFSGTKDSVVKQSVMVLLLEYYAHFINDTVSRDLIRAVFDVPAEHAMVTVDYGNECTYLGSPYINQCSTRTSVAQDILLHLNPGFKKADSSSSWDETSLFEFDQRQFIGSSYGLANKGYVYIPKACQVGSSSSPTVASSCALHVNFHGCLQGAHYLNTTYVAHVGFNEVAEKNNVVVIYPQVDPTSIIPFNPNGCFDWWGYTTLGDVSYASQMGPQMKAIRDMIRYFGATTFGH